MTEKITSFQQLRTWQKARKFAVQVYGITEKFPSSERFGLTSQMQRSAVSVAGNIAEGFSRHGKKDKIHFYNIAHGSLIETLSHGFIALDLNFLGKIQLDILEDETIGLSKMINGMIKSSQEINRNT